MAQPRRYIVTSRRGLRVDPDTAWKVEHFTERKPDARMVRSTGVGSRVVEMTEEVSRELAALERDVLIEEDVPLELYHPMPGLPAVVSGEGRFRLSLTVRDARTGEGLPNVTVYAIGEGPAYKGETGPDGRALIFADERWFRRVIASPADTYWSRVLTSPNLGAKDIEMELHRLPLGGKYGWGHRMMGFETANAHWTGRDVSIAVIDSGMVDDLPDLRPAGGLNTLDGQDKQAWNVDEQGHGTHVGGIIAALHDDVGVRGAAPGASVYSVKVFPGGFLSDLLEAIDWSMRERMDVVSLSLGSSLPSRALQGVLRQAWERGVTSIAAAGNDGRPVAYPAAFPTSIAVSAVGRLGTFPYDSGHAIKINRGGGGSAGFFSASFTNWGPEIECSSPGVAIISTVPTGYAAWDGTSMGSPLVAALAALVLEACPVLRTGDARQPEYVRSILRAACVNLGMSPLLQGYGLPLATHAIAAALRFGASAMSRGTVRAG